MRHRTLPLGVVLALALTYVPAFAQSVVQHHSAKTASGTSVAVALTNVVPGDWLIVDTSTSATATIAAPTDTASDSYTLAVSKLPSAGAKAATYYAQARSGGSITVTCHLTGGASNLHCHAYEIVGLASTTLDVTGSTQTSGTATALSVATSAATGSSGYCHAFFAGNTAANTFTVASGWGDTETTSNSGGNAAFSEDKSDMAVGATATATAKAKTADQFTELISCYKPGSATGLAVGACTAAVPPACTTVNQTVNLTPSSNLQNAINNASSGTLLSLAPGTYNVGTALNLKSGVSIQCQCGAILKSTSNNRIFTGNPVSNVTISNCVIDGNSGGPGTTDGAIYLDGYSSGIHIANNTFQNWRRAGDLYLWLANESFVQNNVFTNGYQPVSWMSDPGSNLLDMLVVSDNNITNYSRMGIETGFSATVADIHIDRNVTNNTHDMPLSIIGDIGNNGGSANSTIWGNMLLCGNCANAIFEVGVQDTGKAPFDVTVSGNSIYNTVWGMTISSSLGVAILNNTFSNITNGPFGEDGGWDGTEWIGTNTVNGSPQVGWPGHTYGAEPPTYSPSTPNQCQ
jgi:hypothetical protein